VDTYDRADDRIEAATGREPQAGWAMLLRPASQTQELIEACFLPGVSVAKLALAHGSQCQPPAHLDDQTSASIVGWRDSPQRSAAVRSPFIPVVPVSAHRSPITPPELAARLPNGVRLEWSGLPADQLAHVLRLLSALPCSDSIPG
jgi:transposase